MQSSIIVHGVPLRKKPRDGQMRVFDKFVDSDRLCIQLPTGYGKTFTAAVCYAIKQKQGINRLLILFPTKAQREQFVNDADNTLLDAGVVGSRLAKDIGFFGVEALQDHRNNARQVFVSTIQAVCAGATGNIISSMMQTGNWMVVIDEYHHYGLDATWADAISALPYKCLLAMSATPRRPTEKGESGERIKTLALGDATLTVAYRDAVKEKAVKPLHCHVYNYAVDLLMPDGAVRTLTTADVIEEAGGNSPKEIEQLRLDRQMRWSPKYVSPLVTNPIERMLSNRVAYGEKLQVLIGAMSVSHAQMVCEQVASIYPDLSVDWVGTGPDGRSDATNSEVIKKFCPPKNADGKREPTLDILVHVGMAGEGLDSQLVSEVIHLNAASKNNSNDQENGRAARYLTATDGTPIVGHINVDASSEYSAYVGDKIMDAMDNDSPSPEVERQVPDGNGEPPPLPSEPAIKIWDIRLESIDSGDVGVQRLVPVLQQLNVTGIDFGVLSKTRTHPEWEKIISLYRTMRDREAAQFNETSVINQWKDQTKAALSTVTGRVARLLTAKGQRFQKSMPADISKRINSRKKLDLGEVSKTVDSYAAHYQWLVRLEKELIAAKEVPTWLS
jgi:superfamily II DNA or RNA helicase